AKSVPTFPGRRCATLGRPLRPLPRHGIGCTSQIAMEIEDEGYELNRRALAREFGVSPQTVARILDGPGARRGAVEGEHVLQPNRLAAAVFLIGLAAVVLWGRRGWPERA